MMFNEDAIPLAQQLKAASEAQAVALKMMNLHSSSGSDDDARAMELLMAFNDASDLVARIEAQLQGLPSGQ